MPHRKRYVLAGTGGRGLSMFAQPLLKTFTEHCELVGFFDQNLLRMQAGNELLGSQLPCYTDFDKMLKEANPDAVLIATQDSTHAEYIIRTLSAGKRAISEKPVCTDAKQAREVLAAAQAARKNGAQCWVTHNMRYGADITTCKKVIESGVIGEVKAVNFHENLDRKHGADYFRRWHRLKKNSGGLLIQKASHHFDALNWLVGSLPKTVVAQGGTYFYGKNGPFRHSRCSTCPHAKQCDFYADLWSNERNRKLYLETEKADGYVRDACVFDLEIDIEDQMGVLYSYANNVQVIYSLTAFASYEGWQIQFEGTKGRLELKAVHDTQWAAGSVAVFGTEKLLGESLTLFTQKKGIENIPLIRGEGEHGGADAQLQADFFGRPWDAEPTFRMAPVEQAIQAILIGDAANISMAQHSKPIDVQGLLK